MLPADLLVFLNDQILCRQVQIRQIASLLNPDLPSSPVFVLHGLEATGKSLTIKAVLDGHSVPCAIIRSRECVTTRHLLERTVIACKDAIGQSGTYKNIDVRCENISVLAVLLQKILEGEKKFIIVFDGIDRQREAPPYLLPAIARLGETIPNLTIVFIVTAPRSRFLHLAGVPYIHFTPYDRSECLTIVSREPLPIFEISDEDDLPEEFVLERKEDDAWLWSRFCGAVWDSLGKGAARDIISFQNVCERLWAPFVQPIRDRLFGTRDFSKLMVKNRTLFQNETALVQGNVSGTPVEPKKKNVNELPYYTGYLLLAAYLASYTPSRQDQTFFMKANEKKRRKKGGGTAKGRPSKHRKIQRKLLGPQVFALERMSAIFHAIVPHPVSSGTGDIMTQIAALASSRLMVKASANADVLDAGTKWRVNVGRDYIQRVARALRFDVEDYLTE